MSELEPEAIIDLSAVRKAAIPSLGPGLLLALSDGVVLTLIGLASGLLIVGDTLSVEGEIMQRAVLTGLMLVPLVKSALGIYSLNHFDYQERTRRTLKAALLCCAILAVPFMVMEGFRSFFLGALAVAVVGFLITYAVDLLMVHGLMAGALQWRTPVFILGAGPQGIAVAEKLTRLPWLGMRPIAFLDDAPELWRTEINGLPVLGPVSLPERNPAIAELADAAIVTDMGRLGGDPTTLVGRLPFRQVYCVLGEGNVSTVDASYHNLHGSLALRVSVRRPTAYLRIRRLLDIVLGSIMLMVAAPLMVGIALAIRLEGPGPVLFRQKRWSGGQNGFDLLKFRTMRVDAEARLQELLDSDPERRKEYETYHKLTDDPRITRVGQFLRKSSLDELPQLWNILTGEMTLIGPRAYMPSELPKIGGNAAEVIGSIRPGLTGYWQVSGRHRTTFCERVEMDVFYVRNCGLLFDFQILCKTALIVLKGDGS